MSVQGFHVPDLACARLGVETVLAWRASISPSTSLLSIGTDNPMMASNSMVVLDGTRGRFGLISQHCRQWHSCESMALD